MVIENLCVDAQTNVRILRLILQATQAQNKEFMVWGIISLDSRTSLVVIRSTLKAQPYVEDILRPVLLPYFLQ